MIEINMTLPSSGIAMLVDWRPLTVLEELYST